MSEDDGDRLVIQNYFDAMAKYKGKPSNFPPPEMCMELIQRDFFQMLDQEMELSEASLAVCLREIAGRETSGNITQYFLNGLANLLDSEKAPWQLKLSRKKWAGKFRSVAKNDGERALWALSVLEFYESEGWPTEAAIAMVGQHLGGLSRASAFKAVKEGRRLRKSFADIPITLKKSSE
jgi:hypothetical protein